MSVSFNLVDQPFIPCLMNDGSFVELGLKETLFRAPEIREVRDGSPLVTVVLHRLLLAILHRNFGSASLKNWQGLWEAGAWDQATLTEYFQRFYDRFDLFDDKHPFFQTAGLCTQKPLPVAALFDELACNNNPTLFDHTVNEPAKPIALDEAARGLVARQGYALGLGISPACKIGNRKISQGNRKDGPLARGQILMIHGDSLFETLMLNLVGQQTEDGDSPIWERDDPEAVNEKQQLFGMLDLYTWQSRRLLLCPPIQRDDSLFVTHVHFAQGREIGKDEPDPMKPYKRDEKKGWLVFPLQESRAVWRDCSALLKLAHDPDRPIRALNWVARAAQEGVVSQGKKYSLNVFGVAYQPGKATSIWLWRQERMPLPVVLLNDVELVGILQQALQQTEDVADVLSEACEELAKLTLAPNDQKADRNRAGAFVDHLAADRLYWSRLEIPFRQFLVNLAEQPGELEKTLAFWVCKVLNRQAWNSFEETVKDLDNSGRLLRAVTKGRQRLAMDLAKIIGPFKEALHEQGQ